MDSDLSGRSRHLWLMPTGFVKKNVLVWSGRVCLEKSRQTIHRQETRDGLSMKSTINVQDEGVEVFIRKSAGHIKPAILANPDAIGRRQFGLVPDFRSAGIGDEYADHFERLKEND